MTAFRFERGPMMSACHLTAPDGGGGFVFCAIPGGTPQFQTSRDSRYASTVVNAPPMMNHRDFERFCRERWADLAGDDGYASQGVLVTLFVATIGTWITSQYLYSILHGLGVLS